MPSFTLFKSVQWAGLESWRGRFWTPNLMFDTPALDGFKAEAGRPYPVQHILWIQKDFIQWNALSCCSQLYGLQRVGGRWGEMVRCTVEHSSPPSLLKVNSRGSRKRPHRPLQCWIIDEIGGIEALCRLFPSSHLNPCSVTHACTFTSAAPEAVILITHLSGPLRGSTHSHRSSLPNIHVHLNPSSIITCSRHMHTTFLRLSLGLHYWNPFSTLAFSWRLAHQSSDPWAERRRVGFPDSAAKETSEEGLHLATCQRVPM